MKPKNFLAIFVGLAALPYQGCVAPDSHGSKDYPYLPKGQDVYKDSVPYVVRANSSLETIFAKSRFGAIPEVKSAIADGGKHGMSGGSYQVAGDGGFPGLILEKGENFPDRIVVTIPDYEGSRVLILRRVKGGWKVESYEHSSEQIVF